MNTHKKVLISRVLIQSLKLLAVFYVLSWVHRLSVAVVGYPLVVASRGYCLFAVCKFLIAVAFLVAKHGF